MPLQINKIPSNTFQNADRSSKHFPYKVLWLGLGIGSVVLALLLLSILFGGRKYPENIVDIFIVQPSIAGGGTR